MQCSLKDSKISPPYLVVLGKEVEQWKKGNSVLLQCVGSILIGADKEQTCLKVTISPQNFLGLAGIPRKKGKTNTLALRYQKDNELWEKEKSSDIPNCSS